MERILRANTSFTPDRKGSVKRPDKVSRNYRRHSRCRKWSNWKLALPLSSSENMVEKIEIAANVQTLKWKCRRAGSRLSRLAPCHSSKNNLQVRHGDQPWYPRVLWPLRWTIAHSTWMVPLQTYKVMEVKTYNREPEAQQVRSFTSLQMVHTHTHCMRTCSEHHHVLVDTAPLL